MPTYATSITNIPAGSISSTNVQTAINELSASADRADIISTISGTASTNDTVRWNGSELISSAALKNDGTDITITNQLNTDDIQSTDALYVTSGAPELYLNTTYDLISFPATDPGKVVTNAMSLNLNGSILTQCSIATDGAVTLDGGDDIMLASTASPTTPSVSIIAEKVWNAVYNDIVDFQPLRNPREQIECGKCYYETGEGLSKCNELGQLAAVGIASDTFGIACGAARPNCVPIAIAGWTLAYVDEVHPPGTLLTTNPSGVLIAASDFNAHNHPECIIAKYMRSEPAKTWGPNGEVNVNGRHWVKVV